MKSIDRPWIWMPRSRAVRVALGAVGLVLLVVTLMGLIGSARPLDVVLATAVVVVALGPTARRLMTGTFDVFEPTFGSGVMLALLFGVRPLYVVAQGSFDYLGYRIDSELTATVALGLVGTASFMFAYNLAIREGDGLSNDAPDTVDGHSASPVPAALWLAAVSSALGLGLFFIYLLRAGPPAEAISLWLAGRSSQFAQATAGSSEYLSAAPILLPSAAIAIVTLSRSRLSAVQRTAVVALGFVAAAVFFVGGDRRFLVPSLAIPAVAYYLAARRRPGRLLILTLVPIVFVVLATVPFARAAGARGQAGGLLPIFAEAFAAPLKAWDRFITSYDTEMVGALAIEVKLLREPDDFYYGRATLGDLLIAPFPSAIFPNKPVTARNDMLIRAFGAPCGGPAGGLCPDFSAIGTFYQDLWWIGVVLGMGVLGVLSRVIWVRYFAKPRSAYRIVLAASWTVMLPIILRAGFMPSFAWWLYFVVPTLGMVALAKAISQRSRKPTEIWPT
jgi:hypothetical protein